MAIEYGDILLNNDSEIYGTSDGDLANGNGKEQQVGAIVNATSGNFRRNPTLAANLAEDLDGPVDSRQIAAKIQDALFLDGWELLDLSIRSDQETTEIDILDAIKITDDTQSLI
jgi:hypothetical protein